MGVPPQLTVLAGGVGAAKFLRGLIQSTDPASLTIIVNTADDDRFFGLAVSPDLDTITYTLAGLAPRRRGWGLAGDRFRCLEALGRLYDGAGWFRLGDRDLATHIYRTDRLAAGASLSVVTAELATAFGVVSRVLPMTDQPVRTVLETDRGRLSFQRYLVANRARPIVRGIRYRGAATARPAPGVLRAIRDARAVIIAPSNPFLSIGPMLALPGIRAALSARRGPVAAVSPLVRGRAVTGPLARLLRRFGHPVSSVGIARCYRPFLDALVIDRGDRRDAVALEREGCRAVVADTIFSAPRRAVRTSRALLAALELA
ncbi:MAG: 2-phospho-L-lactate transferase [Deltaproteobacteria bacterium]|nr:2-phospho-L-lactate transferase [Deltaproteobacteria bacterium]